MTSDELVIRKRKREMIQNIESLVKEIENNDDLNWEQRKKYKQTIATVVLAEIKDLIKIMPDEARKILFEELDYCPHCGRAGSLYGCYCMRDD